MEKLIKNNAIILDDFEKLTETEKWTRFVEADNWNKDGEYDKYIAELNSFYNGSEQDVLFKRIGEVEGVVIDEIPVFDNDFEELKRFIKQDVVEILVQSYFLEPNKFLLILTDNRKIILEVM